MKTSIFSNSLLWFGAAISIAEIMTGTLIAPLGLTKGIAAILIGHIIGCILLYLAGFIGAKTEKSAMETVKISFGQKGSILFSALNTLQLLGWTAVMIVTGAIAANSILKIGGKWVWAIVIGVLILVWVLIGLKNLNKVNIIAMGALFILMIFLSGIIFKSDVTSTFENNMSFGMAVELSVAMPLSWLPLISDYTSKAKKGSTLASSGMYFIASCFMYIIGIGAAIFTGESDIAKIMLSAGFGIAALVIIIFSTVTTAFLDVYSAGVSLQSISKKLKEKPMAIIVCILGVALAIFTPITEFENFLYLIGSVFAPMTAILISDFFILKSDNSEKIVSIKNLIIWVIGFIIYRVFMKIDTPIGNTLPVMIIIIAICFIVNLFIKEKKENDKC